MKKISLYLLLILTLPLSGKNIGGLLFNSKIEDEVNRTTVNLPREGSLNLSTHFSLSFDISLWNQDVFGLILHGLNEEKRTFNLSYIDFFSPDTSFIELVLDGKPEKVLAPIPKNQCHRGKWHNISLKFYGDELFLTLNGREIGGIHYSSYNDEHKLVFGSWAGSFDVPRMAIRNVSIKDNTGDLIHYWPFNEYDGIIVNDLKGMVEGIQSNGQWIIGRHSYWKKELEIDLVTERLRSEIDDINNFLFLSGDSSLVKVDLKSKHIERKVYKAFPPEKFKILYDEKKERLLSFHEGGGGDLSVFDSKEYSWSKVDRFKTKDYYYDTGNIIHHPTGHVYRVGGYGKYTYKNVIQSYSNDEFWNPIDFTIINEEFFPRAKPVVCHGFTDDEIYIFGGHGNKSGKQEEGVSEFHDLWAFNVATRTLEFLWDVDLPENLSTAGIELSTIDSTLFILMYDKVRYKLQLYKRDIFGKGDFEKISQPLDLSPGNYDINLFKTDKLNELWLTVRQVEVPNKILTYSIMLPTIYPDVITAVGDESTFFSGLIIVLAFAIISGVSMILRKRKYPILLKPEPVGWYDPYTSMQKSKGLALRVFNGFKMFIDGREVKTEDWESPKAKELFLFIVLNSPPGPTIEKITLQFWPDVTQKSANNSRYVLVNKIRKMLGPYTDLIQQVDHHLVFGDIEGAVDFDLRTFDHISRKKDCSINDLQLALTIFNSGLLPDESYEWLDKLKEHYHQTAHSIAMQLADLYKNDEQWKNIVKLGDQILQWDEMDDDGLRMKISAMLKLNNFASARHTYQSFVDLYESEFDAKYPVAFDQFS